jgi:hypothetical protein
MHGDTEGDTLGGRVHGAEWQHKLVARYVMLATCKHAAECNVQRTNQHSCVPCPCDWFDGTTILNDKTHGRALLLVCNARLYTCVLTTSEERTYG